MNFKKLNAYVYKLIITINGKNTLALLSTLLMISQIQASDIKDDQSVDIKQSQSHTHPKRKIEETQSQNDSTLSDKKQKHASDEKKAMDELPSLVDLNLEDEFTNQNSGMKPFDNLPKDMICEIFSFLDQSDFIRFGSTSKRFREIAQELWKKKVLRIKGKEHGMILSSDPKVGPWSKWLNLDLDVLSNSYFSIVTLRNVVLKFSHEDEYCLRRQQSSNLTSLGLYYCIFGKDGIEVISQISSLRHLSLESNSTDPEDFKKISRMPRLVSLTLIFCNMEDESAQVISQMRKLRYLDVSRSQLTDNHQKMLSKMPNLMSFKSGNSSLDFKR